MGDAERPSGARAVTVAVPTVGRPEPLGRLLDALAAQVDPGVAWDVLLVVSGSLAHDPPDAATVAAVVGRPAAVVHEPAPGASLARNRAVAVVEHDGVLAFLDDDVVPDPRWLRALLRPILDEEAVATAGPVRLDPRVARPAWLSDALAGYLSEFDLGPDVREVLPPAFVITANAAFTARALRAAGGFAASLGPRPGSQITNEDVLLSWRLAAAGSPVRWVADAVVVHDLPPERLRRRYAVHRTWSQGRSDRRLEAELGVPPGAGAAAARRLAAELRTRAREGPWRRAVALLAVCDLARGAGYLREAAAGRAGRS